MMNADLYAAKPKAATQQSQNVVDMSSHLETDL